jgi:ATP-dependent DNA helicase HFM1/MER3
VNRGDRSSVSTAGDEGAILDWWTDTEGVAIIICETSLVPKYEALSRGESEIESCLHRNLAEHLNSEIGTGTITSFEGAK